MNLRNRPAFTLCDLLVCLAMAGILMGLVFVALAKSRWTADREQARNNLKRIVVATIEHGDEYNGKLPPGFDDNAFSVASKILPQLGGKEAELFERIDFTKSIDDVANTPARRTVVPVFLSPLDSQRTTGNDPTKAFGATNYLFNGEVFWHNTTTRFPAQFTKGASETVIVEETLKAILVDVRELEEWDEGHIKNAVFLPLSKLRKETDPKEVGKSLPKDTILYCHCRSGGRCLSAAAILKKQGYDVRALKPGYKDLVEAGFPKAGQ